MQNSLCKQTEAAPSFPKKSSSQARDTSLIACPIFRDELEMVLAELNLSPRIDYMHYSIHNNPLRMEE